MSQNLKCIILFCMVLKTLGGPTRLAIINGTDAKQGEFPFMVSLRDTDKHICGGTILSEDYILTAAHCVCTDSKPNDPAVYSIQYGLVKKTVKRINTIPVQQVYCNKFDDANHEHDTAILLLSYSLPLNDNSWDSVSLFQNFDSSGSRRGVITGWGRNSQNGGTTTTLQKLTVDIYPNSICDVDYDANAQLCFGSPYGGACFGDSGSCLLVNGVQAGIASFITNTCGIANRQTPNVYARVDSNLNWILSTAQLDSN